MKQSKKQFQEIQISSLDNGCPEQLRIEKNLKSGSYFLRLSEETGEGDKKSLACFPFCGEWVCTMKISYPFTKHIPVVIVMSVSHVSRYAMS